MKHKVNLKTAFFLIIIVVFSTNLFAQETLFKGRVTDNKDEPLIGVKIHEVGNPSNGTITDMNGSFSLSIKEGATIQLSYLGFVTTDINTAGKSSLDIVLEEDAKSLDEVVVIGYGTQSKKTLTGAVSSVKTDEIETNTFSTISHSLAGKAAGLRVNRISAQAGGSSKFRIRGEASILSGNNPLIVIDGFPVNPSSNLGSGNIYDAGSTDNILESLNPNDIESISVLKDAASTAIYGSRAGHGVIIITTKRGSAMKPRVTYSTNMSVQSISKNYDLLNASDHMDIRNKQLYEEYLKANALDFYSQYITLSSSHVTPPFVPMFSEEEIRNAKGTNWLDEVTRTGFMQQHNISINGGTNTTRYLTSINYMKHDAVVKTNAVQRFSARVNLDQDINKYFTVGFTANYSQNAYDNVPLGDKGSEQSGVITAAIYYNPSAPVYDDNGNYYIDPNRSYVPNPVSLLEIKDRTVKDRILTSGYVSFKPIENLTLKATVGADRTFDKRSNYIPKTTLEGQKYNGQGYIVQRDGMDYLMDLTANYNLNFAESHKLNALLGYSYQHFSSETVLAGNQDFLTDEFSYHNLYAGAYPNPTVGSAASKSAVASYFARAHYNLKDRYLLEGTVRVDMTSNFTPENRTAVFPSVSAGWVISEESFMEKTRPWLSKLKLRTSYGQTGNANVGYRINDNYSVGRRVVLGNSVRTGVFVSQLGNRRLTWETTSELNLGLDFGFFNNRIELAAEYFDRKISDLLSTKSLLSYNEVTSIYANVGETQSKGYELTLNTVNVKNKTFSWNSTFTLSHYEDRWSKRDADWKPAPYQKVDDPIRARFTYESLGIMRPGDEAPAAQSDLLPGMIILKDKNEDGVINQDDMRYMGSSDPKLFYGFNNTLKYKDFDLTVYIYGESGSYRGGSFYDGMIRTGVTGSNVSTKAFQSFNWRNTESNDHTWLPNSYSWGNHYDKSIYFVRVGNITLGYKIPINKKLINSLRVYFDVNNPFLITNWTGMDPETDNGTSPYPNTHSYNFGLNITF